MDISNGEGIGVALFVQGCHFHCKNCFNSETWDFNGGKKFGLEELKLLSKLLDRPYINRFSILGGEPLSDENAECVLKIIKAIRRWNGSSKKIWLYTGYEYEEAIKDKTKKEAISLCDVLVDGKFDDSLKEYSYQWAGSTNQRVMKVEDIL